MRIAVGADQRGHIDAVPADIADEVAEDRKAGDDVEALRGAGRAGGREQDESDEPEPDHGYASR